MNTDSFFDGSQVTSAAPTVPTTKKPTAKAWVAENIELCRNASRAELFRAVKAAGYDSASGFSYFKKALLAATGRDWDAERETAAADKAASLAAKVEGKITLYTDAKASASRFAICKADKKPVWHGAFFRNDAVFTGEQSTGEMSAALKAVWLAGQAREAVGMGGILLILRTDAQWLCTLSGKAKKLADAAAAAGVMLRMEWIPGHTNPADAYTLPTRRGEWLSWKDTPLGGLVVPLEPGDMDGGDDGDGEE